MTNETDHQAEILVELTAKVVSAYVSNNPVPAAAIGGLIAQTYTALKGRVQGVAEEKVETLTPAVPVKKSVTPDFIISLEDGKKFKSLKRHLATAYGMTPDEYRARWGLPADYPMVAPNYAAARSELAKSMGLGRKAKTPKKPAARRAKAARA